MLRCRIEYIFSLTLAAGAAPASPTSVSLGGTHAQLAARGAGRSRYGAVEDSVDAPAWAGQGPGAAQQQAAGAAAGGAAGSSGDSIVVSIGQLELGSTLYNDHRVRQMFMLFELLPKFVRQDEQETARVAKQSHMVDFGYTRVFPLRDREVRQGLAALMRSNDEEVGPHTSRSPRHPPPQSNPSFIALTCI